MSELKTLKDIMASYAVILETDSPYDVAEAPHPIQEVLRQEAIKWFKAILKDNLYSQQSQDFETLNVRTFLKDFFNLTDEEVNA
jgi:hypothetical protein